MRVAKRGIALLITLFFIISITLAVGIGLKQVNEARSEIEKENFMIQSRVVLDDVLKILTKMSKEYSTQNDASGEGFYAFLTESAFIPFESSGVKTSIEISSARAKLNVNAIADENLSTKVALESYFESRMIGLEYMDMLFDVIKGKRIEPPYRTNIVYEKPLLFKESNNYISSYENLKEINEFYKLSYHDNKIDKINFKNLFYFSADSNYTLDFNCITSRVKEVIRPNGNTIVVDDGTHDEESTEQSSNCNVDFCASLSKKQKKDLETKYNATCIPQRHINVVVEVMQNKQSARIVFEYNMDSKKGSNFVYEL